MDSTTEMIEGLIEALRPTPIIIINLAEKESK